MIVKRLELNIYGTILMIKIQGVIIAKLKNPDNYGKIVNTKYTCTLFISNSTNLISYLRVMA